MARLKSAAKGFSLVELLTAVLIIGILAAVAIPSYTKYIKKSRVSEAITNLVAIDTYQETYFSENDQYLCLPPNPPAVPQNAVKQNFVTGLTSWDQLGRVIAGGTPLNFQYQAWAGRFTGTVPNLVGGQPGLCVSSYNETFNPGAGSCAAHAVSAQDFAIPQIANSHFFFITAVADQDGDGTCSLIVKIVDRPDMYKKDEIE